MCHRGPDTEPFTLPCCQCLLLQRHTAEICDSPLLSRLEPNCVKSEFLAPPSPLWERQWLSDVHLSICTSARTAAARALAECCRAPVPQAPAAGEHLLMSWCSSCTLRSGSQLVMDFGCPCRCLPVLQALWWVLKFLEEFLSF